MLAVLYTELSNQSKKLDSLNLAGRQRTLVQKHLLGVLLRASGDDSDFEPIRKQLTDSLDFLVTGGRHELGNIYPAKEAPVKEAIQQQERLLEESFELADTYLQESKKYEEQIKQFEKLLLRTSDECHDVAHQIVLLLSKQRANGPTVNLAGRQRTLAQRHAREVLTAANDGDSDYEETRNQLVDSLDLLRSGGDHKFGEIEPASLPQLKSAIAEQKLLFDQAFSSADQLLTYKSKGNKRIRNLRNSLVEKTKQAHDSAHNVVVKIAESGREARSRGTLLASIIGLVLSSIGCVIALVIIKSIVRDVAGPASKIGELSGTELDDVSNRMQQSAAKTSERAQSSNEAATSLDSEAQSLVAAVSQFRGSIDSIVENSTQTADIVSDAVTIAEQTSHTITELEKGANSIRDVVQTINLVAEQTNLLALNATIEAARAGKAGKGFAVVANEVKDLAKQTQSATQDIESQIAANVASTENAIEAISNVSEIIFQIRERQAGISTSVNEQSEVTANISDSINKVAHGTAIISADLSSIVEVAQSTSDASERNRTATNQILGLANELQLAVGNKRIASQATAT